MSQGNTTTQTTQPRIIEQQMPLAAISAHSAREKSIRHGHLSTLHIWWARRPLAACRAAIFAALVPQPDDPAEAAKMQRFIAELANWDNSIDSDSAAGKTGVHYYIRDARAAIRKAFPDRAPRVLDPFAGGGAIPLEALRLGCETYALDLNPVVHIIELATLVYPQKYAHQPSANRDKPGMTLAGDVRKWGAWVLEQAKAELGHLYPTDDDGATPVAYLWARAVPCPNPRCGSPVPLIRQTWLARKTRKYVAYRVESDGPGTRPRFTLVRGATPAALGLDPAVGTSRGGTASCPSCGTPLTEKYIKAEAVAGRLTDLPIAVAIDTPGAQGKRYRAVSPADNEAFERSAARLRELQDNYDAMSGDLPPLPDERVQANSRYMVPPLYGLDQYWKLFNSRQCTALVTLARLVRDAYALVLQETGDAAYSKAVATCLGLAVDRVADANSTLVRWLPTHEIHSGTFGRQALPMLWDYAETNPLSDGSGNWLSCIDWICRYIEHGAQSASHPADLRRGDAARLPYADAFFDAVITDPPYYEYLLNKWG